MRLNQKEARQMRVGWIQAVVAEDGDGCREWPWSARNAKGYGGISWDGRPRLVGHVVLELSGRSRPEGAHQLHSCDNPACVAPWHLRWGSNLENRRESVERERHFTKLTPEQVLIIYRSTERQRDVAAMFGVCQRVVSDIKKGRKWSRVTGHNPATLNQPASQA